MSNKSSRRSLRRGQHPGCYYEGRWKEWIMIKRLCRMKFKFIKHEIERMER